MEDEAWFAPNEGAKVNAGWRNGSWPPIPQRRQCNPNELSCGTTKYMVSDMSYIARRSFGGQAPEAFAAHM